MKLPALILQKYIICGGCLLSLLAVSSVALRADENLKTLIGQEIIGPELALSEVRAYTAARVAPLPPAESIDQWEKVANETRERVLNQVVFRGEAKEWRDYEVKVEWQGEVELPTDAGYTLKKFRYEPLPGLWIPGLLYLPQNLEGKVPVILNVNGHDRADGKASKQKQTRCINLAKRGVIAMNLEWVGMGQLYSDDFLHYLINSIDLCGTSGVAVHYLAMTKALDILLAQEHADPTRVAVAGLSGGGWQTIFLSSLDTRVKLANPVAGYSSFLTRVEYVEDLGDSEQTPSDLAGTADYATLTAMLAPRAALLTFNAKDNCCFAAPHALPPLVEAATPVFKLFEKENLLRTHVNEDPGTHNFEKDNRQQLYKMVGDVFFTDDSDWSAEEIPCEKEIKTKEQLTVGLPEKNASFHSLAMGLSQDLPRGPIAPEEATSLATWKVERRIALKEILHAEDYKVVARVMGEEHLGETRAIFWQLKLSEIWTVPAVMLVRGEPSGTVMLIADEGRKSLADQAEKYLNNNKRVLLVDPFYLGESHINTHDFLYGLLVASVGERPLGIQAGQIAAISRWLNKDRHCGPVSVHAVGPRTGLMALSAGAIEPKSLAEVIREGETFQSLREIVQKKINAQQAPELFCFGLLEEFDVPQLKILVSRCTDLGQAAKK